MDATSEIKARLNVEDVVSQYVQLKRAGRNFKGLSPFNTEKTPSFIVSPEKQIWHDFSSGRGGDIFTFVMEMEGLDFRGALELLARQAGIDLDQFGGRGSSANRAKPRLQEALELATQFYQGQLKNSQPALKYLVRQRGFTKKTILDWRLGYSPNSTRGLTDFLVKKGFSLTEIRKAGLAVERRGQTVDMFRDRVMIPLCDGQGTVVGFTARLLSDEPNAPKYINTPATVLYDKSRHVFGLHFAKEAIRKSKMVVVAEGNLDIISSHQAGIANVVASAGTAMTEAHLKALKRFTGDIRLSFDSDQAGLAAAERVIQLSQNVGVSLKIISLPSGAKDPDELVRKDVKAWQKAIDGAQYAMDWLIGHYKKQLDLTTAQGKVDFTDALLPTLRRLSDPVEQEHYIKQIAELANTSQSAIASKLAKTSADTPARLKQSVITPETLDRSSGEYKRLQNHLLVITFFEPAARWLLDNVPEIMIEDGESQKLFKFLKTNHEFKPEAKLPASLRQLADYVKVMELQFEELYQGLDISERTRQATLTRDRLVDVYVKHNKHALAAKMQSASGKELNDLINQANQLNKLIKSTKG